MKPSNKAVEVLAGMGQLGELVLHQPNSMADLDFVGGLELQQTWFSGIGQTLAQLTALTRLQLPLTIKEPLARLLLLPAGLRELRLGMDKGGRGHHGAVDTDEGSVEFGFPADGVQAREVRRQQPLDLSHLTALTKLQLSAVLPLLAGDALPASLLQLHAWQCFDLQPLLHLRSLQLLALRPSTVPGSQLLALTQLTGLQEVKLFYEGGYYQQGGCLDWSTNSMQQHAAAWPKLPLCSLGFYEDSGLQESPFNAGTHYASPLPAECLAAVVQLTGLTHLALDWSLQREGDGLLGIVQQLTGLRHLSFRWEWITQHFEGDVVPLAEYTEDQLQQAAGDVHALMRGIVECLPQLQQLHWLCDIADERMSLDLAGVQGALQDLQGLQDSASEEVLEYEQADLGYFTMQQLRDGVQRWLDEEELPDGMHRFHTAGISCCPAACCVNI
ncbi:hypothetical protein OEZ85_013998 [Tetradesmus obliquus]|uniref:Uncharacterized protein n=1 Tax=Tetradesmus obliquus TaxID=3088 RepID=A0ABY8U6Z0_TETOB|nr:hypothetical protein OEZ85_013998 [Tetradesmus obliquus]